MREYPKTINGIEIPYEKDICEIEIMLKSDMPYFTVACFALGYKGNMDSLRLLQSYLSNKDWSKRRVAVEAIGSHVLGHLLSDKLINLLDDKSNYVVTTTLSTIRIHCINKARKNVLVLIKSKSEDVRKRAISCLTEIGDEEDFNLITQVFLNEKSKYVKDEAASFIRARATEHNWILAIDLLRQSYLPRHRVWACELISIFGDNTSLNILMDLKNDRDGHVRKVANKIFNNFLKE